MEEISKRLTLHEFFSHLFPGAVALGLCAILMLAVGPEPAKAWPATAFHGFPDESLTAKITAFVVVSYVVGLISLSVGGVIWIVHRRVVPSARIDPLHPSHTALAPDQRSLIRRKACELVGLPGDTGADRVADWQVFQLCYAYCIVNRLDGLIQVMSGRKSMFIGLAGAFVTGVLLWLAVVAMNPGLPLPQHIVWVLVAAALVMVWAMKKARQFDHLFALHVYNTFLMGVNTITHRPAVALPTAGTVH